MNKGHKEGPREAVSLYLQSLPSPPYRVLIFAAVLAALVIALPLQAFGNVFYVLDLVGAMLRFDVSYVGRALAGKDLGPTACSLTVLLIGQIGVAALLTSPFGLKRILFNLYPWTKERLECTSSRVLLGEGMLLWPLPRRGGELDGTTRLLPVLWSMDDDAWWPPLDLRYVQCRPTTPSSSLFGTVRPDLRS